MIVVALLVGRGDPFAFVAWTASGDARFHLLFVRDVLAEGGLHGQAFTYQPQYQEALTALLADTHGRGELAPGELLEHDLHVLAQVSIALTVTWSLATTALLLGFGRLKGRTPAAAVAVASLLPLTGIALGVVLRDGFLPVLLLVPLLLATVTLLGWLQVATDGPARHLGRRHHRGGPAGARLHVDAVRRRGRLRRAAAVVAQHPLVQWPHSYPPAGADGRWRRHLGGVHGRGAGELARLHRDQRLHRRTGATDDDPGPAPGAAHRGGAVVGGAGAGVHPVPRRHRRDGRHHRSTRS